MKKYLTIFLVLLSGVVTGGEPVFVINGKTFPVAAFQLTIRPAAGAVQQKAASELQRYLKLATGVEIPISDNSDPGDHPQIIVSGFDGSASLPNTGQWGDDAYSIEVQTDRISISGGQHKGVLYGVYEFLEHDIGCRFWAPGAEYIPQTDRIVLPAGVRSGSPAFTSREVYYAGMDDQDFADKMRTDRHAWKGAENWGLWVHTMFTLVPPEKYFDQHPEYYAFMAGKRSKTQLCLSNPEVLRITVAALRELMKEKPEARYWSVSQMDTYGNCECDLCRATDEKEGSPSGSMIKFVNQVAASFPDKVISTLAYQYTRKAPRFIKPAGNVNIMLCTIECDRSKPLEADTSAGSFTHDLREWAAISQNILVWDYVIQFTNMLAPFPNLPVLQPNVQLFEKYHVTSLFEQGCRGTYSENQELRQYLLAKLLWNPHLNTDSLQREFLQGYYGTAGSYIGKYLHKMEKALQASGKWLWIYGSPIQETDSYLGPDHLLEYRDLFTRAMKAVEDDSVLTRRVIMARLPLDYAMLEIKKKYITGENGFMEETSSGWRVKPGVEEQVGTFARTASRCGVKTLHERSLPPETYEEQTIDFFNHAYTSHLAKNRPYRLDFQPADKYSAEGDGSLTDGKRGSANYYVLWQGFEESDLVAVVDLEDQVEIKYLGAEFLQDLASWIFYPTSLVISISTDGKQYEEVARFDSLAYSDPVLIRETGKVIAPSRARYVKFHAVNTAHCPAWHIGHGGKAWLFADELIVN